MIPRYFMTILYHLNFSNIVQYCMHVGSYILLITLCRGQLYITEVYTGSNLKNSKLEYVHSNKCNCIVIATY